MAATPKHPAPLKYPDEHKRVRLGGDGAFPPDEGEPADPLPEHIGTDDPDRIHVLGSDPASINLKGGDDNLINENPELQIIAGAGDDYIKTVPVPSIHGGPGEDVVVYKLTNPADTKVSQAAEKFADELSKIAEANVTGVEKVFFDIGDGKPKTFGIVLSESMPTTTEFLKPSLDKIGNAVKSLRDLIQR